MYRVILLAAFVSCALGQVQLSRNCSTPVISVNVNIQQFLGTWYQLERLPNSLENGDCSTTTYSMVNNTGEVSNREMVNGNAVYRNGTIASSNTSNAFVATYSSTVTHEYFVLTTDYNNYALLYMCQNVNASSSNVWAWKMSKTSNLTALGEAAIHSVLQTSLPELLTATWRSTNHTGCSGSAALISSPILALFAMLIISKELF